MKPMMVDMLSPMMTDALTDGSTFNMLDYNPQNWYDAADDSTITEVLGAISQWSDKSGFNRHATQGSGANQATYLLNEQNGKNVIDFDGSQWFDLGTGLDWMATDANHTCFVVTQNDSYDNIYGAATPGQGDQSLHVGFQNAGNYRLNRWGNDTYPDIEAEYNVGQYNMLRYVWPVGSQGNVYQNGTPSGLEGPSKSTLSAMAGGGRIANVVGQPIFDGKICEIVFLNYIASAAQAAAIEAHLTAKWGV